jgi:RNA polymerase sigma factor (sigma-70 family)
VKEAMMIADAMMISADRTAAPPNPLLATIRAAKSGDSRAFEERMIATERRVALLAWRILGDAEEVKDALQETFLRLFRHLKRYDEDRDFHGWLARITINVCRDLERGRRRRRIFAPLDDAIAHATNERVEDAVGARRDAALVSRAIDDLPERERLVIILRDVEGMTTEEAAQVLGNTSATIRVQLSRARAKVRRWVDSWRKGAKQ